MALEKLDGVSGAFVNKNIDIHFSKDMKLDEKLVAETIKPFGMKVKGSTQLDVLPF